LPLTRLASLLRFTRKSDPDATAATKQPDGQISKNLSSPRAKNIPLNMPRKSAL
jgi:hypothetical protein